LTGVGSQTQALKNLNIEHEVVAISEIDKYAIETYKQLHGEVNNLGDISKIQRLPKADLWTYSFPCQDLSLAGKLKGIKQGTRSGLLLEVERLLDVAAFMGELPKYLLLENVRNLVSKRFKPDFDNWLHKLETLGYTNYWQVLNAKDYGIPQNRERVFCVSILGNEYFEFPKKQELKLRLKDLLEDEVDKKYYLSEKMIKCISAAGTKNFRNSNSKINLDVARPLTCTMHKMHRAGTDNYISAELPNNYDLQYLKIKNATKQGYLEAFDGDSVNLSYPTSDTRRGRVGNQVSQTITTSDNIGVVVDERNKN
jgi:DNA (cytosine-5)-methyltransferase 1